MAEPEELLSEAARAVAALGMRLCRRAGPPAEATLEHHRRRLELLVAAATGEALELLPAQPSAPLTLLRRLFDPRSAAAWERRPLPGRAGRHLLLPPSLPEQDALAPAACYRLLALHQAARRLPARLPISALARDLLLMRASLAAERHLVAAFSGLAPDFERLRAWSLRERPQPDGYTALEREIEALHRRVLLGRCGPDALPRAEAAAARFPGCGYRGIAGDWWLGTWDPAPAAGRPPAGPEPGANGPARTARLARAPKRRVAEADEDDREPGPLMLQTSEPMQHAEDAHGLNRSADRGAPEVEELADSLSDLPELRVVNAPGEVRELLVAERPAEAHGELRQTGGGPGLHYPEWDFRRGRYRLPGVRVDLRPAREGGDDWAQRVTASRPALVAALRRQMQRLRPQRLRLWAQSDGEEIDIDACVRARSECASGAAAGDRVYGCTRPLRRDLAVTLLMDVSGSTERWVANGRHGIEVAREALLLICLALEEVAVPFSVLAFSGETTGRVALCEVKEFAQRDRDRVWRRIAGIESERFTRLGGALRHATSQLAQRRERRRVLLLISDGRPYDADCYGSRYGVEDSRRAVLEARRQGIAPFCLAVDAHPAPELPVIFGAGGYRLLRTPAQLPEVTAGLVRRWAMH